MKIFRKLNVILFPCIILVIFKNSILSNGVNMTLANCAILKVSIFSYLKEVISISPGKDLLRINFSGNSVIVELFKKTIRI